MTSGLGEVRSHKPGAGNVESFGLAVAKRRCRLFASVEPCAVWSYSRSVVSFPVRWSTRSSVDERLLLLVWASGTRCAGEVSNGYS
jgi:hypothetical protein